MQSIFIYTVKVVVCSGIFFLYYLLALRNKKFHPYNRFYLLATAALSCLLPLLHISMFDVNSNNEKMLKLMQLMYGGTLPDVVINGNENRPFDWGRLALFASLSVTVVLSALIVIRIYSIYRLKKSFPVTKIEDVDFVNTDIQSAPFSFFKNLFWRMDIEPDEETGSRIFRHEMAHIEQKHSWDKLFFRIVKAVFWMNPVFYFMNRELMLIHEFIADEKAVQDGDGESFAKMLLMTQVGKFAFEPAHPFFYSTIKKRLKMITDSQKTKFSYLRRMMVLPLLGAVSFAFAFRAHRIETKKTEIVLDNMIDSVKNEKAVDTLQYTALGKSFTEMNKPVKHDTLSKQALYILNGIPLKSQTEMTDLDPKKIESISVLKESTATSLYGDKGKNGVVLITTKTFKSKLPIDSPKMKMFIRSDNPLQTIGEPLYIIDGKASTKEKFELINPDNIQSVSILKDQKSQLEYGLQGRNGVISIVTKKQPANIFVSSDTSLLHVQKIIFRPDNENRDARSIKIFTQDTLPHVFVASRTADRNGEIEFTSVQHEAVFPGGPEAWQNFLKKNLKQNIPVDNGAPPGQYAVTVSFLVDKAGNLSEVKAIKSPEPDYGTAAETVRVIAASSPWKPAIQNGRKVTYRQKQRIIFTVQTDDDNKKKK